MSRSGRTAGILLSALLVTAVRAQERPVPSAFERAREHAVSVSRELLTHLPPDSLGRVAVRVEGEGVRFLFENAMIEALRDAGVQGVLGSNARPEDPVLHVFILDQRRSLASTPDGRFVRALRTSVEGRLDRTGAPVLLGAPVRESVDTVAVAESGPLSEAEEPASVFDTVLTPFIVLGGVALTIYLLFTVRS